MVSGINLGKYYNLCNIHRPQARLIQYQQQRTNRGTKIDNAALLAIPCLSCITVLVKRQEGTRTNNRGPAEAQN